MVLKPIYFNLSILQQPRAAVEERLPPVSLQTMLTDVGHNSGVRPGIHKEFLNVRDARKKADQDAQLLANRCVCARVFLRVWCRAVRVCVCVCRAMCVPCWSCVLIELISFASRIALLEAEERKAWKKIHQTKERATNVIQVREEAKLRKREQQVARKTDERRAREEVESRYLAKEMERQAKKVRGLEGVGVQACVCVCV